MADRRVVVIGGGLGGLSAGCALAREGLSVTLLEKGPRVGGYAVAWKRGGYSFDLALHVAPAGGPGQEFSRLAGELGLPVRFRRLADGFHVRLGDWSLRMPNEPDALFTELARAFPAERVGLGRLRRDLKRQARVYARLFDPRVSRWRSLPPFLPRLPLFLRQSAQPASGWLAGYVSDPRLAAVLFMPAVFMGIPPSELAAVNYLMMASLLLEGGMHTIEGGGQALTDALERRFLDLGGRLRVGAEAVRIVLEKGRVRAVQSSDGSEFPAEAVVAALNLPETVGRLVGREHFPASYLRNLASLSPSLSVLALNLGLDRPPRELGIGGHITAVFPGPDLEGCLRRRAGDGFSVTAPGNTEPQGEGRWTLSLVTGADPGRWLSLPEEEYREAKRKAEKELLAGLDRAFPGAAASVSASDLATPRTLGRYTGNPGGAIMGFSDSRGVHRRIMAAARMPVRGLHLAGAWTPLLGGFLQCVKSGGEAARRVLREVS